MPLILGTNSIKDTGYDVANSLRFDSGSSDHLNRSTSSGDRLKWTWSAWLKKTKNGSDEDLFSGYDNSSNFTRIQIGDTGRFNYINKTSGSQNAKIETNRVFRDNSAWYHFVIVWDTGNATAGNRMRIYVNGVEETSFANETQPSLNQVSHVNQASKTNYVGTFDGSGTFFNGYMAEVVLVDGQALDPTSFGEFDSDTNIWKPISVSGLTFGTNGFYLDFENSGSLGADVSGNGNNFTVNNLTSVDQSTDTCTNNFATLNPLFITRFDNDGTFSEGNLKRSFTSANSDRGSGFSTIGVTQGKWYWEVKVLTALRAMIGVGDAQFISAQTVPFYDVNPSYAVALNGAQGALNYNNTSTTSYHGSALSDNDIVQVALDMDNHLLWFGINGTWLNSATQTEIENSTATNDVTTDIGTQNVINNGEAIFPFVQDPSTSGQANFELNFGNPPFSISSGNSDGNGYGNFEYAVPTNYYSLNSKNLAEYG